LGWGATICPDVAAASLGIVALYVFRHWIKTLTWFYALLAGITLGLLTLTKLTWIVAFGLWLMTWLITTIPYFVYNRRKILRQSGQMVFLFTIAVFVLNLGYCFDGSFKKLGDYTFNSKTLTNDASENRFSESWLGTIPVPLPEQFVLGFDTQQIDFEKGKPSYLFGQHAKHGWWHYYLAALTVKEPIGTLGLVALAVVLFCRAGYRTNWKDEFVILVPLLGLLIAVSSQTGFSANARYVMPALPILYIWASRTGRLILSTNTIVRAIVPVLLIAIAASSLWVYPYSMSYLNETVRGRISPPLLGSNIDWGQDLYELKDWLDEHPETRPIRVAMSNIYPLETLGITNAGSPPKAPAPGWFLLGANDLFGTRRDYEWLWNVQPVKRVGWSTYIFHVTVEEANRLREQNNLPVLIDEDFE
jgi:hypothetical protein